MEILYDVCLDIIPHAQERSRVRVIQKKDGGKPFAIVYDPEKSKKFKKAVQDMIDMKHAVDFELIDQPMILSCQVYIQRPKSVKREHAEVKPDLSNYIKGIEDAMNKIVYTDDSKIVGYSECWKRYTDDRPRIEITLYSV